MNILNLATIDDQDRALALVSRHHEQAGYETTPETREAALDLLFSGEVQAAIWLIGPRRAPVGYIAVSFGFSLISGGREATIDGFFIRESVRGRGMGGQALATLVLMLKDMGIMAVRLDAGRDNDAGQRLFKRAGFETRQGCVEMVRVL